MTPALLALSIGMAHARNAGVVMTSEDLPRSTNAATTFTSQLGRPVEIVRIGGDRARAMRVAAELTADPPPLIFALGEKAAWTAVHHGPNVPIVHAMVDDPVRYEIDVHSYRRSRRRPTGRRSLQDATVRPGCEAHRNHHLVQQHEPTGRGRDFSGEGRRIRSHRPTGGHQPGREAGLRQHPKRDRRALGPSRPVRDRPYELPLPAAERFVPACLLAWSPALVEAGALMAVTADGDRVARRAARSKPGARR